MSDKGCFVIIQKKYFLNTLNHLKPPESTLIAKYQEYTVYKPDYLVFEAMWTNFCEDC